jgi:ketosteroid isomerase-like protein
MTRRFLIGLALVLLAACATPALAGDEARVRAELEQAYKRNEAAMLAKDLAAVMALRTEDFHSVTPDGLTHDRAAMEGYSRNFLAGVQSWISLSEEIESLTLDGDEAAAIVRQHAVRMHLRNDGKVHHVETWVTQRETWRRTAQGWKLARVDQIRDQKRLVDGVPG